MRFRSIVCLVVAIVALAVVVAAQDQAQTTVKHVTAPPTSAASGAEMFKAYCAACHGADGKGNGPAAPAMKVPPTDLTSLAKNNGGKFPEAKVSATIRGEADIPAHGSREMPVWGKLFWAMSHGHEGEVQQRVSNLNKYLESLQAKYTIKILRRKVRKGCAKHAKKLNAIQNTGRSTIFSLRPLRRVS